MIVSSCRQPPLPSLICHPRPSPPFVVTATYASSRPRRHRRARPFPPPPYVYHGIRPHSPLAHTCARTPVAAPVTPVLFVGYRPSPYFPPRCRQHPRSIHFPGPTLSFASDLSRFSIVPLTVLISTVPIFPISSSSHRLVLAFSANIHSSSSALFLHSILILCASM